MDENALYTEEYLLSFTVAGLQIPTSGTGKIMIGGTAHTGWEFKF
jgi:hypothetical protein